jgi:hypothetical protein
MRPCCECCGRDLAPDGDDTLICSFECTFCRDCDVRTLHGRCPNCGGMLLPRPPRDAALLARHPASAERIVKDGGCA